MTISEWQYELSGVAFGYGTSIEVTDFEIGGAATENGDVALPLEDGVVFGRDTAAGRTLTWELMTNTSSSEDARTAWQAITTAWNAQSVRRTPTAVVPLMLRLPGSGGKLVYGRPRRCEPGSTRLMREGVVRLISDFATTDHKFYSETENSLTLTLLNAETAQSGTLNSNATFETGVDGWTKTGCNLTQPASGQGYEGDYAGVLTPDGATSAVRITSDSFYASADVRFHPTVRVKRASGGPVPMTVGITFYDADNNTLATSTSNATNAVSGSWTKVVHSALAPTGTASAAMHVAYNDSTPASSAQVLIDNARTIEVTGLAVPARIPFQLTGNSKRADAVTNAGDMETWPVITFEGPLTNPSVEYVGTGRKLKLTMAIPAGHSVTIDTRPWVRTALQDGIGSVAGKLAGTRMADMALRPGTTVVAFRGQDPTGLSRCRIYWRSASSTP